MGDCPGAKAQLSKGGDLLLIDVLGRAVPFVVIGLTLARAPRSLTWQSCHHRAVEIGSSTVIVVTGMLLFTGSLTCLNQYFGLAGLGPGASI